MNREAINTFLALVDRSSDLQGKVADLKKRTLQEAAEGLALLCVEVGCPVTAEEWLTYLGETSTSRIADRNLEAIAGGSLIPPLCAFNPI